MEVLVGYARGDPRRHSGCLNRMGRWFLIRLLWLLVTLFGVTFVTFFVLDCAPVDRAEIEVMMAGQSNSYVDIAHRNESIKKLRVHYGMDDPVTGEPLPLWRRYSAWIGNALTLRLAGPGEDHAALCGGDWPKRCR